ncbi:MAG: hypothetical protein GY814_09810 [Gammaproteobacteria bacterium]|nr:hypothetical protein [Gammaproteobacteria bacterium]
MAAKDADLASDYASRELFITDRIVADFEVSTIAGLATPEYGLFLVDQLAAQFEVVLVAPKGGTTDETPPSITNLVPADASELDRYQDVTFDAIDLDSEVRKVLIWVDSDQSEYTRMVFDGDAFLYPFQDQSSFEEVDASTLRFILKPTGGWVYNVAKLTIRVVDSAGNFDGEFVI